MHTDRKADSYRILCSQVDVRKLAAYLVMSEHTEVIQIGRACVGIRSHSFPDALLAYVQARYPHITKASILQLF